MPVSVEEGRTALVLTALFSLLNLVANGFSAYFANKNKTEIELAKIAAESAKDVAEINAAQARKAHKELSEKVDDVQASIQNGNN